MKGPHVSVCVCFVGGHGGKKGNWESHKWPCPVSSVLTSSHPHYSKGFCICTFFSSRFYCRARHNGVVVFNPSTREIEAGNISVSST